MSVAPVHKHAYTCKYHRYYFRRFAMNSLNTRKLSGVLLSASAVMLFHAQSGLAADAGGDPQGQARELLSPTVIGRSADVHDRVPFPRAVVPNLDPQAQARQLILGGQTLGQRFESGSRSPEVVRSKHRGRVDAQAMARRMILGAVG
jgi:hypothetical protein